LGGTVNKKLVREVEFYSEMDKEDMNMESM
jgi:hypothetical protein